MMRIDVTLTIKENLQGQGNTSCGHYDYEFVPDVVHVCKQPAEIVYSLAGEDCDRFAIAHMYTTDIKNQLSKPQRNHDDTSISVFHSNTDRQLIVVSLRVRDRGKDRHLACDPQVTNDPPVDM
jgi:hypothetical protein